MPIVFIREDGGHGRVFEGVGTYVRHSWLVLRGNPEVGQFLLANAAWEGTFAGARTFVVLYITVGLDEPLSTSTLVLAAVAAGYIVSALVSGPIGDRFGLARVITGCSIVYGVGLLAGGLATTWHDWYLPVVFFVALFGGSVMTLAWGLLFKLMPPDDRGAISGLATTTKGLGLSDRAAARRRADRHPPPAPAGDRRLSGALADAGRADPARGPPRVSLIPAEEAAATRRHSQLALNSGCCTSRWNFRLEEMRT